MARVDLFVWSTRVTRYVVIKQISRKLSNRTTNETLQYLESQNIRLRQINTMLSELEKIQQQTLVKVEELENKQTTVHLKDILQDMKVLKGKIFEELSSVKLSK